MFVLTATHRFHFLSTDGKVSFAAFVYEDPGEVMGLANLALVGFDAGDTLRSGVVPREDLQVVNIFRIDGKDAIM